MHRSISLGVCLISGLLLGAAAILTAGPLTPPAGPVAGTYKTLGEVEPRIAINATNTPGNASCLYRITQPGSYYLTGNVTAVIGKHGILIATSGVTLDLNGFDVSGIAGMGSFSGVTTSGGSLNSISVLRGSIRNWGDVGLDLRLASNCRVEGVLAASNLSGGITVGPSSTVAACVSVGGNVGITLGAGSTADKSTSSGSTLDGFYAGNHCVLTGCTVTGCTSASFPAVLLNTDCVMSGCTANLNAGTGVFADFNCIVDGCVVISNGQNGITVTGGCTVRGCTVTGNPLNGIESGTSGFLTRNLCNSNGLAAGTQSNILLTGDSARVESNSVIGGDRGIATNGGGNVIVGNSVRGGTNAYGGISAGNDVGPIGSAATATSSWANIAY